MCFRFPPSSLWQVHPKTKIEEQDELSSLLQVPLVVSSATLMACTVVQEGYVSCNLCTLGVHYPPTFLVPLFLHGILVHSLHRGYLKWSWFVRNRFASGF